jgi:polar amino acid transport system substrate-binding protein
MKSSIHFLFLFSLCASLTAQAQCRKSVRWNNDNLLQVDSTNKQNISSHIKLLHKAINKLDCQVTFLEIPWGRSLIELQHGRVDIMGGAYKTAERQQFAWYSDFAFDTSLVLFIRTEDIGKYTLNNLQDIPKYQLKIGTQINAIYSDEFSQLLNDKNFANFIHPNTSRKALWTMLQIGRIDGFISELTPGLKELESLGLSTQISPSDFVISTQTTHFIFSKKSVTNDFVKAIDRELLELSRLDEIEPIKELHKY